MSDLGDWILTLWKKEKRAVKILGLFKTERWVYVDYDQELAEELVAALSRLGIQDIKRVERNVP